MTAQEKVKAFSERIKPQLDEMGVAAFILCGYMEDENGKTKRITLGGTNGNPAYEDGLQPMKMLSEAWGQGQL